MLGLKITLRCLAILLTLQCVAEGKSYPRNQMLLRPMPQSIVHPSLLSNHSTKHGPWTPWSTCSRTCGTGLMMRSRPCLRSRPSTSKHENFPVCRGDSVEHKICNIRECPRESMDFRSYQCSQYNNRVIAGQMVTTWITSEGGHNPCELRCEARREKLVYSFGKVADGTSCSSHNSAICLDGRCLTVGCDGNPGSGIAVDMCGVCGGRNATCIHYKDVYLGQPSGGTSDQRGTRNEYREIAAIPVGARNLEIVQPIGQNILAMQDQNNGLIFNGKDALSIHRGKYYISGTSVEYVRKDSTTEILRAAGPTTMDLYVLVLLRARNPGIHYQYWLFKDQNHLKRSYLFPTTTSAPFPVHQVSPAVKDTDHTTPLPFLRTSPGAQFTSAVDSSSSSSSSTKAPVAWSNRVPVQQASPSTSVMDDHYYFKSKATSYEDLEPKHKRNASTPRNFQNEKTSSFSTTSTLQRTTTPRPTEVIFQVPLPKPRYRTPKPALGYYQMFRKEMESNNDPPLLYPKSVKILPDNAQGDSSNVNGGRWQQSLVKGSQNYSSKARHIYEDKTLRQPLPSRKNHPRNPIINQDLNSRWAYKLGRNGEEHIQESEYKGRYASTPVTIAVLPLPETSYHNATDVGKKRGGRKHSKLRLTRGGLCGPCQKVRDQTKHFCHSDFVIRASIVDYEFLHGETRYEMQVLQSFKNTLSLLPREYIWAPDTCKCPKLRVGREYILMGRSDNSYRKNESRLLVDKNCFVRSYNAKYGKRLFRLRKDQRRKCRKVS